MRIAGLGVLVCAWLLVTAIPVEGAGVVVGTFDSSRAGAANLFDGSVTTLARASTQAHFPNITMTTTPTLTPAYLSSINTLVISSVKDTGGITPLSGAEQTALFNFVKGGGTALLLADGLDPFVSAAQSLVTPFGMTIVDDGVSGLQFETIQNPAHPIFSGPWGVTTQMAVLGAGVFTNIGPYSTNLATMNSTGLPVLTVIEQNAIAPGSGRVIIYSDATLFADPGPAQGFFAPDETLFLNTIQYLLPVPEPATFVTAALGLAGLLACGRRRRVAIPSQHPCHGN